ncbi:MAG: glycosyltransferase [Nitrososphaeria archaeon]
MKPKVTVGICVRNGASTLRKAIESVMIQDYPHELMEVIFVDDGSTDDTLFIMKYYASKMDMNVKVFYHKWKGLGYTRNVVVNNANGDYILWVDADLILPFNYITKMIEFMERNNRVAIAAGSYEMLDQKNLAAFLDNVEYVAYHYKSGTNLPGTGGAMFRVKAIREIGGFDENIKGSCEDIDIAYRLLRKGWTIVRDLVPFYSQGKEGWRKYWVHSLWHGYGAHYFKHKNKHAPSLSKMTPPIALIRGIAYSVVAYKMLKQKKTFLLPIFCLFKNIGWWTGFIKGHIDGYGHKKFITPKLYAGI